MIKKELLEEFFYKEEGFKPLVIYKSWRVAVLNFIKEPEPDRVGRVERHPETDEVFVLMQGSAVLFVGEGEPAVNKIYAQVMQPGVVYNVKPKTWHTVELSRDASILIVENADTSEKNSEYCKIPPELGEFIRINGLKK